MSYPSHLILIIRGGIQIMKHLVEKSSPTSCFLSPLRYLLSNILDLYFSSSENQASQRPTKAADKKKIYMPPPRFLAQSFRLEVRRRRHILCWVLFKELTYYWSSDEVSSF
jgi:hypothetical protein